jgi:hypothetical protein
LEEVNDIILSSAQTTGPINKSFDTVNLHRLTKPLTWLPLPNSVSTATFTLM